MSVIRNKTTTGFWQSSTSQTLNPAAAARKTYSARTRWSWHTTSTAFTGHSRQWTGYKGVNALRKKLRKLPGYVHKMFGKRMLGIGHMVERQMILGYMPHKRTGHLIGSIATYQKPSDPSRVVIGPGANAIAWQKNPWDNSSAKALKMSRKQKAAKWAFFKAYWMEWGTEPPKGKTRGRQPARPISATVWKRVSGRARQMASANVGEALAAAISYERP